MGTRCPFRVLAESRCEGEKALTVARQSSGRGIGRFVLDWAEANVRDAGGRYLRLDCHAANEWLCGWYRANEFAEVARIEQHPGYLGVLFQKVVAGNAKNSGM